jgi:hypothetical protein
VGRRWRVPGLVDGLPKTHDMPSRRGGRGLGKKEEKKSQVWCCWGLRLTHVVVVWKCSL